MGEEASIVVAADVERRAREANSRIGRRYRRDVDKMQKAIRKIGRLISLGVSLAEEDLFAELDKVEKIHVRISKLLRKLEAELDSVGAKGDLRNAIVREAGEAVASAVGAAHGAMEIVQAWAEQVDLRKGLEKRIRARAVVDAKAASQERRRVKTERDWGPPMHR